MCRREPVRVEPARRGPGEEERPEVRPRRGRRSRCRRRRQTLPGESEREVLKELRAQQGQVTVEEGGGRGLTQGGLQVGGGQVAEIQV